MAVRERGQHQSLILIPFTCDDDEDDSFLYADSARKVNRPISIKRLVSRIRRYVNAARTMVGRSMI